MSKQLTILGMVLISTQLTGCSTLRGYFFKPVEATSPLIAMEYNFIQPRRTELPPELSSRLRQTNGSNNRFSYYSASGYECRTLSLTSLRSACNINGRWQELAPILSSRQP